jgi:hypothetical protein
MKTPNHFLKLVLIIGSVVALGTSIANESEEEYDIIRFQNVPVPTVLTTYKNLSGQDLVIDSRAKASKSQITLRIPADPNVPPLTQEETLERIRKALIQQAGIVVTPLDSKRTSVTFNDALPIY